MFVGWWVAERLSFVQIVSEGKWVIYKSDRIPHNTMQEEQSWVGQEREGGKLLRKPMCAALQSGGWIILCGETRLHCWPNGGSCRVLDSEGWVGERAWFMRRITRFSLPGIILAEYSSMSSGRSSNILLAPRDASAS